MSAAGADCQLTRPRPLQNKPPPPPGLLLPHYQDSHFTEIFILTALTPGSWCGSHTDGVAAAALLSRTAQGDGGGRCADWDASLPPPCVGRKEAASCADESRSLASLRAAAPGSPQTRSHGGHQDPQACSDPHV